MSPRNPRNSKSKQLAHWSATNPRFLRSLQGQAPDRFSRFEEPAGRCAFSDRIRRVRTFPPLKCYLAFLPVAYRSYMGNLPGLRPSYVVVAVAAGLLCGGILPLSAQDAAAKQPFNKVIGAVVSVDADGKKITVKDDSGNSTDVLLNESTSFMLVPPGEKDLRKATRIELKDIGPGDRVYARSRKVEGQDQSPATSVIVMSKTDVAQHQERTRDEWQRRGVSGKVASVDPVGKTVTVSMQSAGGPKTITVQIDDKTRFRRYAPDSVKFADAQPSQFKDIDIGNNLRVLGDKNADGTSIHAEEILSGSFRNIGGTVISVDAAANEIKVNDLVTKQPVTVKVNADTNLRRLPVPMAMMLARASGAGPAGANGGAPAGSAVPGNNPVTPKGQGGPDSHPGFNGPGSASPSTPSAAGSNPAAPGADHPGPGMSRGHMDVNQILERAPHMAIADLKAGDALVISSTNGADPSRVTAISVIAGVEPILAAAPPTSRQGGRSGNGASGSWTLEMGMPE